MKIRFAGIFVLLVCWPALTVAQEVIATSSHMPIKETDKEAKVEKIVRIALSMGPKASTPAQLVQLTRGMDGATASQAFLQVARGFLRQGNIDVAADSISHLLKEFPAEPAATDAGLLLLRIYSSIELAHTKLQAHDLTRNLHLPAGWQREADLSENLDDAPRASQNVNALLTYSGHLIGQLVRRNPKLAENPEFAFQAAVVARRNLRTSECKSWLTIARHQQQISVWRQRAMAETWLREQPDTLPPVPVVRCGLSADPPHLDGTLSDACWQQAAKIEGAGLPAEIFLARDTKYCFLAGRCECLQGADYSTDDLPRTYDADLEGRDRIEISLDVDRDYESCYRLTVDYRGWTNDSCWLDRRWNPRWYVAARQGQSWTFEAAIPWSELASCPPQHDDAWAVAARRVSDAEDVESTTDFQLLLFD